MFETSLNNAGHGSLVKSYVSGQSWYRVYSDGWCEQGGYVAGNSTYDSSITLLKPYKNSNYNVTPCIVGNNVTSSHSYFYGNIASKTASSFHLRTLKSSDAPGALWSCRGYV